MSEQQSKWTEVEHLPEWDEEFYDVYTAKKHGKWLMLKTLKPQYRDLPEYQAMIEKEFDVRLPESQLDEYIRKDKELRLLSYKTLFHKVFFENIDDTFPYQDMKLKEIGIPLYDVIQVSSDKGEFFVRLSKDAVAYGLTK